MRETIIKLLLSSNSDDIKLGKEYLYRFYKHEFKFDEFKTLRVLTSTDLNKILMTDKFMGYRTYWIFFKDDME